MSAEQQERQAKGKYIVLEGPNGVGKTSQVLELAKRLQVAGLPVITLTRAQGSTDLTGQTIARLIEDSRYPMSNKTEVLLYNAASAENAKLIKQKLDEGVICLADHNYLSTLVEQYYGRGIEPDYKAVNQIVSYATADLQPDLCIVIDVPVAVLKQRLAELEPSLDDAYLERVRAGYLWEAKQRNLPVIFASQTRDVLAEDVWRLVAGVLATRNSETATATPTSVKEIIDQKQLAQPHEPPLTALQRPTEPRPADKVTGLADIATSATGHIYALTPRLEATTLATAVTSWVNSDKDLRQVILGTTSGDNDPAGQDQHQAASQLNGIHFVIEDASDLLIRKVEWGRRAAYAEQIAQYSHYDEKDADGKYKYLVPYDLKESVKKQYIQSMDTIFALYSAMVKGLTNYLQDNTKTTEDARTKAIEAIMPVLPVATKSQVGVFASGRMLESLIMRLLGDDLAEAKAAGQSLLEQARQVVPMFLDGVDKPELGGVDIAYLSTTQQAVAKQANELLPETYSANDVKPVTLIDYWPKNELLLTADMLYEHSSLPLEQIQTIVSDWSYKQKSEVFKTYIGERLNRRHRPGRALEKAHYSWDIVCDYGIFRDLQRHRMVDDLTWQQLTPRYGYEVPALVEEAGLTEQFEACFDVSLKLYSLLQQSGYQLEAQYATLLGHRMRWKITYNAREAFHFHELRTSPQGHPGYRKLVLQMHEKLAEVHPQLAEAMKFVNQDEDPELTRLAAERYTQFKLERLEK